MVSQVSNQIPKRKIAYKMRIGDLLSGKVLMEGDRMRALEIYGKEVVRVNLIANVIDKYTSEGDKKYVSITLDDASGQIKVKFFGEDVSKAEDLNQGNTVLLVGFVRNWNDEIYLTPEIVKKKDSAYLLVRKYETELERPKVLDNDKVAELRDKVLVMIKNGDEDGGVDIDKIIMDLKESPEHINLEVKKLLEDGMIYEPRPGKLRYLG